MLVLAIWEVISNTFLVYPSFLKLLEKIFVLFSLCLYLKADEFSHILSQRSLLQQHDIFQVSSPSIFRRFLQEFISYIIHSLIYITFES